MSAPLERYLRTYRKRFSFSQDDVAFLLGVASGAKVSRYERRAMQPKLETVLAYEVIFQAPVKDLFAGLYQKVEKQTLDRARLLIQKLNASRLSHVTAHKLAALRSLSVASGSAGTQCEG